MNIENVEHSSNLCVNFDEIYDFSIKGNYEKVNVINTPPNRHDEQDVKQANKDKLDNWKILIYIVKLKT